MFNYVESSKVADFTKKISLANKKPLIIIEPKGFSFNSLKELWLYRELCYFFVWRDLVVRYRQTFLGVLWALLQPFLTMLILNITLGNIVNLPGSKISPTIFFYTGLIFWTFFSNSVNNASHSLVNERALITKVYFPRATLINAKVLANLVDLAFSLVILFFIGLFSKFFISWKLFLLPVVFFLLMCFTFSISILLASLNVIYRDVRFALPFIIQALFFTTPVIFPINMVSEKYRWLLMLNPLVGIIEGFRASLFDYTINLSLFFYTIISTIVVFFFCFAVFVKLEKIFAERV